MAGKCSVAAEDQVTVEIHQQPGDRSCKNEAIGGAHYDPATVYMSNSRWLRWVVQSFSKMDGHRNHIANLWTVKRAGSKVRDYDNWSTKDLTTCCGKANVKILSDIPPGDYLLLAEALALHTAQSAGGAQFYMTCCMSHLPCTSCAYSNHYLSRPTYRHWRRLS